MSLGESYLLERGIDLDFASVHGIEIDQKPNSERIKERLGGEIKVGDRQLSHVAEEIIWIPLRNAQGLNGEFIARPLPNLGGCKFLCACDRGAPIYIPPRVYQIAADITQPLIITEGPIKALAIVQAGFHSIGLNGVWCAAAKDEKTGRFTLRQELQAFALRGRKIYIAFDADLKTKPEVRQASVRLFLLLAAIGAEVFQLTSWDESQGKGIDDLLVNEKDQTPAETLQALMTDSALFSETLQKDVLDVSIVSAELAKVEMPAAIRAFLTRQLGRKIGVSAKELRRRGDGEEAAASTGISFAQTYQPWAEAVDGMELLNLIMVQIAKEALLEGHQLFVCAVWICLTWIHRCVYHSPILYITAPTKECGKTNLLTAIGKMVKSPCETTNISAAALYRITACDHPTILADEVQDQSDNEDFWLVIKSGHVPGKPAIRCHPNTLLPEAFDVFCPKALSGIGRPPSQVISRSIVIEMERRRGKLQPEYDSNAPIFVQIRSQLERWALDVDEDEFKLIELPESVEIWMRNRDNWRTLYRVACSIDLSVGAMLLEHISEFQEDEQDFATCLLAALRRIYRESHEDNTEGWLSSDQLVELLNKDKEAPWYARSDKGITTQTLSNRLKRYRVKSDRIWDPESQKQLRGYRYINTRPHQSDLKHAFAQYLPEKEENEK